jgi:hypothetical protein
MKIQYHLPSFHSNKNRELAVASRNREIAKLYKMGIASKTTKARFVI